MSPLATAELLPALYGQPFADSSAIPSFLVSPDGGAATEGGAQRGRWRRTLRRGVPSLSGRQASSARWPRGLGPGVRSPRWIGWRGVRRRRSSAGALRPARLMRGLAQSDPQRYADLDHGPVRRTGRWRSAFPTSRRAFTGGLARPSSSCGVKSCKTDRAAPVHADGLQAEPGGRPSREDGYRHDGQWPRGEVTLSRHFIWLSSPGVSPPILLIEPFVRQSRC